MCGEREDEPLECDGGDGGVGGAGHAEGGEAARAEDENGVENDVEDVAEDVDPEDDARLAEACEVGARGHLTEDEEAAEDADVVVGAFA